MPQTAQEVVSSREDLTRVLVSWGVAGAGVGVLVSITRQLTGSPGGAGSEALFLTLGGFAAGGIAWRLDQLFGQKRPTLRNARGDLVRPSGGWLLGVPLAIGALTLALLAVVGSVRTTSLLPALVFGGMLAGLGWFGRNALTQTRLSAAIALAELDDHRPARQRLLDLAEAWWTSPGGRAQAQLTLGYLALTEDELDSAARWYTLPRSRMAGAYAATGLAFVRALQSRHDEAEHHLQRATRLGRHVVQSEADGIRLLGILEREGHVVARDHGEHLFDERAGGLFRCVLAVAHLRCGQPALAQERLQGAGATAQMKPLLRVLPDLANIVCKDC